jgi:hypothetical protein
MIVSLKVKIHVPVKELNPIYPKGQEKNHLRKLLAVVLHLLLVVYKLQQLLTLVAHKFLIQHKVYNL